METREQLQKAAGQAREAVVRGEELLRQAAACKEEAERERLLARAEAEFQAGISFVTDHPQARAGLGRAALDHFDLAFRRRNWDQAAKEVELARKAGTPEEKIVALKKRVDDARAAEGCVRRVPALVKARRFDEAITACSEAIKLNPLEAAAYRERAEARRAKGDLAGSIPDYDKAIELAPGDAAAYNGRGCARPLSDIAAALRDFDEAVRLKPDSAEYIACRGQARLHNGKPDEAIKDFDKALSLDPRAARTYVYRGLARRAKDDVDGAIRDYDKALELSPRYPWAYLQRAGARSAKGAWEDAFRDYEKAVELSPKYAVALNALAWTLLTCKDEKRRDPRKALPLARKAVELTKSEDPGILDTLALALFENGQVEEAVKLQEKAISLLSSDWSAEHRKEFDDRLARFRKALEAQKAKRP